MFTHSIVKNTVLFLLISCNLLFALPEGFVYLKEIDPTIIESPRYATAENFLGKVVPSYEKVSHLVCTLQAAQALKKAHEKFKAQGYTLVVYDAYRPQTSVNEFMRWSTDINDQIAKTKYYPNIDKKDVFELGYVAEKSGHSRGSTVDLTLIKTGQSVHNIVISMRKLNNSEEIPFLDDGTVDMGASFDLFHVVSHHDCTLITPEQTAMREFLRTTMKENKFKECQEEWWHYTLKDEPFPADKDESYMDFIVGAD